MIRPGATPTTSEPGDEGIMTNSTIQTQLAHRTIRRFTADPVSPEDLANLVAVARQTASSSGAQLSSVIRVTDPTLKTQVATICRQPYVAEAPELWITLVDAARGARVVAAKGYDETRVATMDVFFQAATDAVLLAQNVATAAESLGLGTCFLGSILNDPAALIELLGMPPRTFPVLGLMVGHPAQAPQLKPRMPMDLRLFENHYVDAGDGVLDDLAEYDAQLTTYYDLRDANRRVDSYTEQLTRLLLRDDPERNGLLRVVSDQGFDLAL